MAGNAWEWRLDWYAAVHRAAERGKVKVVRGGSWYAHFASGRGTYHEETRSPAGGYRSVGFRIVAL